VAHLLFDNGVRAHIYVSWLHPFKEQRLVVVGSRKMEGVVEQLGLERLDKSKVSRMTKERNDDVEAFRSRPLEKRYAYVWLDAVYPKARQNLRIVSPAFVIALGVDETGHPRDPPSDQGSANLPR